MVVAQQPLRDWSMATTWEPVPCSMVNTSLSDAVAISPIPGKARKQLILALLDDPECRLSAGQAEVLLRWRMMSAEPSLSTLPALQPSPQPLQPHMLRAALSEDAAASTPVILLSDQALAIVQDPSTPMVSQGQVQSWVQGLLQLDVRKLSASLCLPPPAPSPKPEQLRPSAEVLDKPLPTFLYEYESPATGKQGPEQAQSDAGSEHRAASSSAPSEAGRQDRAGTPALGRDSSTVAIRKQGSSEQLVGSPSHLAATLRMHSGNTTTTAGAAANSSVLLPSSALCSVQTVPGVPEEVASCWGADLSGGSPTHDSLGSSFLLTDQVASLSGMLRQGRHAPLNKQQSGPCTLMAPERRNSSGLATWVSTSPSGMTYCRQHSDLMAGGPPPIVANSFSSQPTLQRLSSRVSNDGWGGMHASSAPFVGSLLGGAGYLGGGGSFSTNQGMLLTGLSSQLSGHLNTMTSPERPTMGAGQEMRTARIPRVVSKHLSPESVNSEDDNHNSEEMKSSGAMDLETALEAIINYESATGEGGAGAVSAATAAAAQHALQQHVAAAMRAANTGGQHPQQPTGAGAQSQGSSGDLGASAGMAAHVMQPGDSRMAPGGGVYVAATPAQAGYLQHQMSSGFEPSLHMGGAKEGPVVVTEGMAMGMLPASGPVAVSLSAPRASGGWANMVATQPRKLEMPTMVTTDGLLASSAPPGSLQGPTLMAAAARSMALQQQQQQRQVGALGVGMAGGLQRSMTTNTAAALYAAAQQQGSAAGLPLLQQGLQVGPGGRVYSRLSHPDVQQLLMQMPGLKVEDLDDGIVQQLIAARRNEEDALAALRALTGTELAGGIHPTLAAYVAHGDGGVPTFSTSMSRTSSAPVASRAMLQKLPPRVYARLEEVVSRCSYMDWKHFDAGVVKVMSQLSELSEADVLEELQLLEATDLSNVEYMPAYLNKRLNNRLWSRRKAQQALQQPLGH